VIQASHPELGDYWLYCDGGPELLFTENETNSQRLWRQTHALSGVKDGFDSYLILGDSGAINPARLGTKATAHYVLEVPGGASKEVRLRLTSAKNNDPFGGFSAGFDNRVAEANEFYDRITPASLNEDQRRVHRQALGGMLW